jgi:UDP-N-acetylmuramoyl-L-alanyl-D-glutamate--2,6-diaminopimelate ligase
VATLRVLLSDLDLDEGVADDVLALDAGGIADDSRHVRPGDLFVAVRGQTVDGHAYLSAAAANGAVAAVVEARSADFPGPQVVVRSTSAALALIAARFHGRPADALRLIAVTGTNGKTTTTHLVESLLLAAGRKPGIIGTVAYRSPAGSKPAPFTTPTPRELHATLAQMRDAGATDVAIEVSSHALALDRVAGLRFAVAAFTNLTQDHLDFHGTMTAYGEAKARLFSEHMTDDGVAVICVDGDAQQMLAAARGRVLRVSARGANADVRVESASLAAAGTALSLSTPAGPLRFTSPLVGGFNVENLAVAAGIGVALGLDATTIAHGLSAARGAPGRLERVGQGEPAVYVDYAHTPDALERALEALRPLAAGRRGKLWVVFGCGGDRDRSKRPAMGRIAEAGADRVIVTSDNPRTESPQAIVDQIIAGLAAPARAIVLVDRHAAIERAVAGAAPADVVLVAGKGHEDYQVIGREKRHFDDREVAAEALQRRGPSA